MNFPGISGRKIAIALIACSCAPWAIPGAAEERPTVERYALYVASNDGGASREKLRYAGTDAERLAKTMNEVGGVKKDNSVILIDPTPAEIDRAFESFRKTVESDGEKAKRTEFLFYYSGHSNEKAFLLGKESYDYAALKAKLNTVPTDVHVVMLDSCYSGNFVRAKGGSRDKPFLMDDASVVQGHAYLSSSSEDEASQESDRIQASYFTQALVTGLRGAADASGDGRVSLNELYYYAFNDTLSQTETSAVGPQHPAYNITLVGSGDLVLTDITDAESVLFIPKEYQGSYFIRKSNGDLVSELNKIQGTAIALALPAGDYTITLVTPTLTLQGTVSLVSGQKVSLDSSYLTGVTRTYGRTRGEGEETATEEKWIPFGISLVPGMTVLADEEDNVNVSIGVFMAQNRNISGAQVSLFGGAIPGRLSGVQAAGFMNSTAGPFTGAQWAGFMNTATGKELSVGVQSSGFLNTVSGPVKGVQASGFMNTASSGFVGLQTGGFLNIASGESKGAQISGFLNIADHIDGTQIGVINIGRSGKNIPVGIINVIFDGIIDPAVFIDTDGILFIQYQGGTRRFFTTLMAGCEAANVSNPDYAIFGFGIGTKVPITNQIALDLEIIARQIVPTHDIEQIEYIEPIPSLRATLNYSFARHLTAFASINLDCNIEGYNDEAFDYGRHGWSESIADGRVNLYPTMSYGLKF